MESPCQVGILNRLRGLSEPVSSLVKGDDNTDFPGEIPY